jgi:hypothetical protein
MMAKYGNDIGGTNYGRDILKDYTMRRMDGGGNNIDFGNSHLQGNEMDLKLAFFRASYMWKHNLFLDLETTLRSEKDEEGSIDNTSAIFGISVRWNVPVRQYIF